MAKQLFTYKLLNVYDYRPSAANNWTDFKAGTVLAPLVDLSGVNWTELKLLVFASDMGMQDNVHPSPPVIGEVSDPNNAFIEFVFTKEMIETPIFFGKSRFGASDGDHSHSVLYITEDGKLYWLTASVSDFNDGWLPVLS